MRGEVACWDLQKIQAMVKQHVKQRDAVGYDCPISKPLVSKEVAMLTPMLTLCWPPEGMYGNQAT